MKKIRFRLTFNKKKATCENKPKEVKIEAGQYHKAVLISTNIYLYHWQWDEDTSEIINHPNSEELNRLLQEEIIKLEWYELQCWKNGHPIKVEDLKHNSYYKENRIIKFVDLCNEYIINSNKKESTKKNLMSTVKIIEMYSPGVEIADVNYDFLAGLEYFLTQRNYNINTITKHIKHIKSMYNEAVTRNIIKSVDIKVTQYKTKHTTYKYSFLTPDELKKLEIVNLPQKYSNLQHSLDAFLFCCYTGMRYSDFRSLDSDSIVTIDGNEWIVYKSPKTDVETRLPLYLLFNGKPQSILYRYKNDVNFFFKIKPNSSVDKDLIKIKKLACIKTHISFHTARHTNATLLIYMGVNITTVQKLLGHRNIKTTQRYVDILPEGIVNDLKKNFG